MEFLHIVQPAFRGIVGNVISPATDVVDIADQIRTAFVQGIAHGDRSVDVEQEKLFIFQTCQLRGIAVSMVRVKSIHNVLISELEMLRFMLAMNVVTVKEKTARGGKMCGGKRKWNCVSIYGMIGIDVRGGVRSKAA